METGVTMRRKDREIKNIEAIKSVIDRCKTCHLAMVDEGMPYVVPMSFGYQITDETLTLFFHSAHEGRKIDILHRNNVVCFEMCVEGEPIFAEKTPCSSGYSYSSILGSGRAEFIADADEKCRALSALMKRQANVSVAFTPEQAKGVCVFQVVSHDFTGKRKPKPTESV